MKAVDSQTQSQAFGLVELKMKKAHRTRSLNKEIFAIFKPSVELTGLSMLRTLSEHCEGLIEAPALTHIFPCICLSTSSSFEAAESS